MDGQKMEVSMNRPEKRSRSGPIAVLVMFAMLIVYVGGYLLSGSVGGSVELGDTVKFRTFNSEAEVIVYTPAAKVESGVTGTSVWLCHYID
jgi:hypothetical protein